MRLPILLAVLLALPTAVAARQPDGSWWQRAGEAQVGQYWIKSDADARTTAELARHLNLMYAEFARRLASLPQRTPERLNVLLFADRADYLRTLRMRFGVDGRDTGGMFIVAPQGTALAVWVEDLPRRRVLHVLQHEGFHQFAYSRFGDDLPAWVNEGLAEFFGTAVMVGRSLLVAQAHPRSLDTVREAIELGSYVPFRRMLRMTSEQWNRGLRDGSAPLYYHQSWSMVQFLIVGEGGRHVAAFEAYLRLLNAAVLPESAFVRAFGDDVQAFEDRWKAYVLAASPSGFVAAMERIEALAEGALELSRRGIVPTDLDGLHERLVDIGFRYGLVRHGFDVEIAADDPELYRIPRSGASEPPPVFVVEPINPARLPARLRYVDEQHPPPPLIRTAHLEPYDLSVAWQRDRETGRVVGYEIAVK